MGVIIGCLATLTLNSKHSEDKFSRILVPKALTYICVEMGFDLSASHLTTWLSLTLVSDSSPGGWVGWMRLYVMILAV